MASKAKLLLAALAAHSTAQDEYARLQRELAIAETVLETTRHAVEQTTNAIKDEGVN